MSRALKALLVCLSLVVFLCNAGAATWVVEKDGTGDFTTIQEAIDAASPGDLVLVGPGIYTDLHLDSYGAQTVVELKADITVRSSDGPDQTILDAATEGPRHVVTAYEIFTTAVLDGFTVQGGDAELGGGIYLRDATVHIFGNEVLGNLSGAGGGVVCDGFGTPVIEGNLIEANQACCGEGGGVFLTGGSSAHVLDNEIRGNSGFTGGGIALSQAGDPFISQNLVIDNLGLAGGGLGSVNSGGSVEHNRFIENEAQRGGGVSVWSGGSISFSHNVVAGNTGTSEGGGYHLSDAAPVVMNETIAANSAFVGAGLFSWNNAAATLRSSLVVFNIDGEGIYAEDPSSVPEVTCSDVYENAFGDYGGAIDDRTGYDGNISVDPRFCDAGGGDYRLAADSPLRLTVSRLHSRCGIRGAHDEPCDRVPVPTLLAGEPAPVPYPNPSRGIVWIPLDSGAAARKVEIVDVTGRRIRRINAGSAETVLWDGSDDRGLPVASGIYFVSMQNRSSGPRIFIYR